MGEEYEKLDEREKHTVDGLARDLFFAYSGKPDVYGQLSFDDLPIPHKAAWIRTAMWVIDETFTYETSYTPSNSR